MNRRSIMGFTAGATVLGASVVSRGWAQTTEKQTPHGFRWLDEFARKGTGASDDTGTFLRAIDFVRNIALRTHDTSCLPALLMPSGRYVLTKTIETAPWIKLCSVGGVLLDFSSLPAGLDGLTCRNETALPPTELRFPGDRSPFLDGGGGAISILGPGTARAEGWGIVMGNRQTEFSGVVRDAGGRNIVVSGWRGALRIDPVNTYLSTWFSSRFEQNREHGIYVARGERRSQNSGERMTFVDCTISGSARAIDIQSDSMDFMFDACSFDFNGDVVHFGSDACFGTVAFNHCHFEGIDGLLVNATESGQALRTVFRDSIVLPRHWKRKELTNAPRRLVAGTAKFSASGVEWRLESPQQGALTPLIGDEVPVESLTAMSFQQVQALPWRGSVLNVDSVFASDKPGTLWNALTHWSASPAASAEISGEIVSVNEAAGSRAIVAPGYALRLTLPNRRDAHFSLSTKTPFPVIAGENVAAACAAATTGATGSIRFTFRFYALGNIPLGTSESQGAAHELQSTHIAVPAGASQAVLTATFIDWTGTLEVGELAVWRVS
ncbi:hypothetical protein B0G80_6767 [Paraburkholderia sp. BL6669N2]|uniref:hypothetical protein n=1 Tax=Paraburkholderia sp. BL6669N2 TaxID=1938807 RepID=UPI000E26B118|nr:hypothetical protein [Paraburkholderia sp. BL6669N2]REG50342.1 hypothetical protein B0G80_6767 [Paraburkholderia sp. BL6669N2]